MNIRIFIVLSAIVVLISGGAYYFSQDRKALHSEAYEGGLLLAKLQSRVNDVDMIRVESQEGGVVDLARDKDRWMVQNHHNYRANPDRVSILLKQVATLEKIEPKTAKPQNHARLNLDDPSSDGTKGTRVTLKVSGENVADVIFGLVSPPQHGGGTFVRLYGEDQTWLVKDEVKPRRRTLDLLDRSVVNVDGRRIRSTRIQHSNKKIGSLEEIVTISKTTPDQSEYDLGVKIPAGFQAKANHEISNIARVPDFMILEDVKPAERLKWDHSVETVYETFDGLRLKFYSAIQDDGKVWSKVLVEMGERSSDLETFINLKRDADTEEARIAQQMKTQNEVAEEAKLLDSRVNGWAYRLTDYKSKRLTATPQDVIDKPEAAQRSGSAPRQ